MIHWGRRNVFIVCVALVIVASVIRPRLGGLVLIFLLALWIIFEVRRRWRDPA